ncbi:MAG: glycoside hydrolase family 2 protein [Xylanivirga thermophila]|jgi:beta-galactosidase|uniref:glycoside hydrolase family 2 protein n=1 Tax=Xylanivirga thermophila TaxID=2496273 RepID=UPI0039F4B40D
MRIKQKFNHDWYYIDNFKEEYTNKDSEMDRFCPVLLPHANKELPYSYFDEKEYQFISCYKKDFTIEKNAKGKTIFIEFEGVMAACEVYVNGKYVGEHRGGYVPAVFDITPFVQYESKNTMVVKVDSREREDIPPFGNVIDYLTFGGIYRDVYLYILDTIHINNVFYNYKIKDDKIILEPIVYITSNEEKDIEIVLSLDNKEFSWNVTIQKGKEQELILNSIEITNIEMWDIKNPVRYSACMILKHQGKTLDNYETKLGFRNIQIDETGFHLNGRKIKLRGLNRHQSFPYVGYAMPKRVQQKDADILKYELGLNIVRTSHYPQSPYFLDRCDEIGLLVLEEIPGWQHISKREDWRNCVLSDVEKMIARDRNHPAIIMWGVRINESGDDHELYTRTNALARKLDPTRPTTGIRCICNSEFLEDVYAMNDFIYDGGETVLRSQQQVTGLDHKVPYIITEYNGHMFPTKRFDNEHRLIEHAMRHAIIQNEAGLRNEIMGAIGWCAFDYNTHCDFGSGDRICYHGVMDMFRIPKWASYVYLSQVSPKEKLVLQPLSHWTIGDRNQGGVSPLIVLTNCDHIEIKVEGKSLGKYYPDDNFRGLEHPPITVDFQFGEWGVGWGDLELLGYVNDEIAITRKFAKNPYLSRIDVKADDTLLYNDEMDATRIVCKLVDQYGNILPYLNEVLYLETQGDIEIIGPKTVATMGGCIGFWIKTTGKKANTEATVTIRCDRCKEENIKIQLRSMK